MDYDGIRPKEVPRMPENVSTLQAGCERYVGRTLIVEPHYGYGWAHPPGGPFGDHGTPPPFHVRVGRVYSYLGERRGILARVTEPGFVSDGFWLVSMTRHLGEWNFTDRPANYNLLLCPDEPAEGKPEDAPEYGKLWPVWHLRGHPQASGFGRIAESLQWCADYDAKRDAEAEQGISADGGRTFRFVGTIRLEPGRRRPPQA
jgi:hypothetical protein